MWTRLGRWLLDRLQWFLLILGLVLFIFCTVAWPVSQIKNGFGPDAPEPWQILALSWGAMWLTALTMVTGALTFIEAKKVEEQRREERRERRRARRMQRDQGES